MITRIEVEDHDEAGHHTDVTFFFVDEPEDPYSAKEFTSGTATRRWLNQIEDAIAMFNSMEERGET